MGIPGSRYREVYEAAERDPETFWLDAARAIDWVTPPRSAFDPEAGIYGRWFPDAVCNTCHNALDRHVAAGWGDRRQELVFITRGVEHEKVRARPSTFVADQRRQRPA